MMVARCSGCGKELRISVWGDFNIITLALETGKFDICKVCNRSSNPTKTTYMFDSRECLEKKVSGILDEHGIR